MELFGKIFIILSTGIFLSLLTILFEHPKRWLVGGVIYGSIIVFTLASIPFIAIIPLCSPLLILMDAKRITWKNAFIHLSVFMAVGLVWCILLIDLIPFYYYPFIVFFYVLIAKHSISKPHPKDHISNINSVDEII